MGCVQAKPSMFSPPRGLEKLKLDNGYVKGGGDGNGGRPIGQKVAEKEQPEKPEAEGKNGEGEGEKSSRSGSGSKRNVVRKIAADELVDGWPKWLVDNIPKEVLAGLVPKSADSYEKLAKIGQGTYSNVYKARDRDTSKIVALKKVRFDTSEPESIKFMAREIMILQKLDHPNVIKLEGLATSRMQYSLYLVFEYMLSDLTRIISRPGERLTEPQVKSYMQQLLLGLQHCHERGILHRDIKASNLLIDRKGMLKIADFGLANIFSPNKQKRPLTSRVVTLWYRAPELLLGSTDYGVGIDLWSAGCLLGEMFVGRPIMPGRTEVEQLHKIFKLCGCPQEDYWKRMKLQTSFRPPSHYKPSFQEAFRDFPSSSFGLLTTLLALEPVYRASAASALQSQFFTSSPLACQISDLPVMYKEEDDLNETHDRKKHRSSKRKQSRRHREDHVKKEPSTKPAKEDTEDAEETEEMKDLEYCKEPSVGGHSASSSTSSSFKPTMHHHLDDQSLPSSLSPVLHSKLKNQFPHTEAHPNALKNVKNFTLLQASIKDIVNHNKGGGGANSQYRRSFSTLDFRNLDPDKVSKLFEFEKD